MLPPLVSGLLLAIEQLTIKAQLIPWFFCVRLTRSYITFQFSSISLGSHNPFLFTVHILTHLDPKYVVFSQQVQCEIVSPFLSWFWKDNGWLAQVKLSSFNGQMKVSCSFIFLLFLFCPWQPNRMQLVYSANLFVKYSISEVKLEL